MNSIECIDGNQMNGFLTDDDDDDKINVSFH